MNTTIRTFEFKHFIVLTARGTLDLAASKAALRSLVSAPDFGACSEVLLDLRDVECEMSASNIHELAKHMTWHIPTLYDDHRIAILVKPHRPGKLAFNHPLFRELCSHSRGFNLCAFEDYDQAIDWLNVVLPLDAYETAQAQIPAPSFAGRQPQFGLGPSYYGNQASNKH